MLIFECQNEEFADKFVKEYMERQKNLHQKILKMEEEERLEAEREKQERLEQSDIDDDFKEIRDFLDNR